ncbi:cyclin-J-like isoform X1 [Clytia hemisphaerica]|uniref:Cyclin-J n=1 Tax=Clytia hemisphaerica TaxID=252671 RepID=A0A7M5UR86_9CNID
MINNEVTLEEDSYIVDDTHKVLREKERSTPKFQGNSPQLCFRRYLVDWLALIGEKLHLTHGMVHLGVALMDSVMDKMDFPKQNQLNLMAICCLYVATKVDERDDLIPRVQTLKSIFTNDFEVEDFLEMELNIMSLLEWRLLLPTPVHFIGFYLEYSIDENDKHSGETITHPQKAKMYLRKYTMYFLEVALQNHEFNHYLPSIVTSSAIAASRLCLKITPTWCHSLEWITKYDSQQIEECVDKMIRLYQEDDDRSK